MTLQEEFELIYQMKYGVKPVFLVESKVYALNNQQIAYECFFQGHNRGFDQGFSSGWDDAQEYQQRWK